MARLLKRNIYTVFSSTDIVRWIINTNQTGLPFCHGHQRRAVKICHRSKRYELTLLWLLVTMYNVAFVKSVETRQPSPIARNVSSSIAFRLYRVDQKRTVGRSL